MNSIEEIRALHTGHWFDKDARMFFKSRLSRRVYPSSAGTYFVSSERFENAPRLYTVRLALLERGRVEITTIGSFGQYPGAAQAHRAAKAAALAAQEV